ncbi:uncharacterized protein [Nicotiana tomentosiformis]|uniref:uncharacterized protein n=1 Tax=Nicotiana tomentosiformis TaxID=4098 RepID=UPI00388CB4C3
MTRSSNIRRFQMQLGFQHNFFNCNNKIWLFWDDNHVVNILEKSEQQVTCSISYQLGSEPVFLTVIYAKCKAHQRLQLWEELRSIANRIQGSWGVVGDFNVIIDIEEKRGGRPFRIKKSLNFLSCISDCGLLDAGLFGNIFTWSDNRGPPNTIWKRLDTLLINEAWGDEFSDTSVIHLARDQVLRQKAKAKWLEDGDKNTAYFHSVIKGGAEVAEAAVEYFQHSFNHGEDSSDFSVLECVLPRISEEDNEMLVATPTVEEIKDSLFSIDPSSAPGPDGLSALFY